MHDSQRSCKPFGPLPSSERPACLRSPAQPAGSFCRRRVPSLLDAPYRSFPSRAPRPQAHLAPACHCWAGPNAVSNPRPSRPVSSFRFLDEGHNASGVVKPVNFKAFLVIPAMRNDGTYYRLRSFRKRATTTVAKMPLSYTVAYTYTFLQPVSSVIIVRYLTTHPNLNPLPIVAPDVWTAVGTLPMLSATLHALKLAPSAILRDICLSLMLYSSNGIGGRAICTMFPKQDSYDCRRC